MNGKGIREDEPFERKGCHQDRIRRWWGSRNVPSHRLRDLWANDVPCKIDLGFSRVRVQRKPLLFTLEWQKSIIEIWFFSILWHRLQFTIYRGKKRRIKKVESLIENPRVKMTFDSILSWLFMGLNIPTLREFKLATPFL